MTPASAETAASATPAGAGQPGAGLETDAVYCMDALELLRALPDASVDLICTDPPYNGVKDEAWDNQWATDADYIAWIGQLCEQWKRVLKPNGSLYVFASPRMAARVEVEIGRWFNVLNRITWQKPRFATKAEMFDKDTMRAFFPASEAIIFAEQITGEEWANAEAGWLEAETTLKRCIFGDYLRAEITRAGSTAKQVAALFPSASGGLTGCVSNWYLGLNIPTPEQYQTIRVHLGADFLSADYDTLRAQYDTDRRQLEALRIEREAIRRPFNVSPFVPYTDVWTFATVGTYPGKHPCEKPLALLEHIIKASTRAGDVVLDCFAGSGATLDAARRLGRCYIGGDMDAHWVAYSERRLSHAYTLPMLFADAESEGA